MTIYLRILLFGLALNCNALPAAANWLYTPGAGPSAFRSFNSGTTPAGTSACAAANTDCLANVPIDITGTPLFATGNAGLVTGTGGTFPVTQATAASLNATVVGTGTFATQAAQSGTWNITNISGTISLPTGAATSALQTTGNTALTTINTTLGTPMQNSGGSVTANAGTNLNTSALGTSANQATVITALNTLNTTAGSPIPQCASLTACNVIGQVQLTPLPRAARNFTGCVVGTSSTNCLAANTAILYLETQNTSPSSNVACKPGGTPVLNDSAGSYMMVPNQAKSWGSGSAGVPTGQLNCIASNASTPIYIEWD